MYEGRAILPLEVTSQSTKQSIPTVPALRRARERPPVSHRRIQARSLRMSERRCRRREWGVELTHMNALRAAMEVRTIRRRRRGADRLDIAELRNADHRPDRHWSTPEWPSKTDRTLPTFFLKRPSTHVSTCLQHAAPTRCANSLQRVQLAAPHCAAPRATPSARFGGEADGDRTSPPCYFWGRLMEMRDLERISLQGSRFSSCMQCLTQT